MGRKLGVIAQMGGAQMKNLFKPGLKCPVCPIDNVQKYGVPTPGCYLQYGL